MENENFSYEMYYMTELYFEKIILNKFYFDDDLINLRLFFKYDICDILNDFIEIHPNEF